MESLVMIAVSALFLIGIPWGLFRLLVPKKGRSMCCSQCGHIGPAERHTKGSMGVELLAWLLFLIPGLIYSLWRLSTRADVCASCGSPALVSPSSPVGRRITREAGQALGQAEPAAPAARYSRP